MGQVILLIVALPDEVHAANAAADAVLLLGCLNVTVNKLGSDSNIVSPAEQSDECCKKYSNKSRDFSLLSETKFLQY
jgi:hypothetical protein